MKSSATVTAADRSSDPRQPSLFEKKKNMGFAFNLGRRPQKRDFAGVLQPGNRQTVPRRLKLWVFAGN